MHDDLYAHDHAHGHHHDHDANAQSMPAEERLALLKYMLDHNRAHAEELHGLGHEFSGETSQLIHEACDLFTAGNGKLEAALSTLQQSAE